METGQQYGDDQGFGAGGEGAKGGGNPTPESSPEGATDATRADALRDESAPREAEALRPEQEEGRAMFSQAAKDYDPDQYRELHKQLDFFEYLAEVKANPAATRFAFQRIYDMVMAEGYTDYEENGEKLRHYKFFDDPHNGGEDAVVGMDSTLMQLVDKIKAASKGFAAKKRIFLLWGPVGSAKSTITRLLRKGLEHYSRQQEGALFTFGWKDVENLDGEAAANDGKKEVRWSKMNEDPLSLIPEQMRSQIDALLNDGREKGEARANIPKEALGAFSNFYFEKLMEQYDGDLDKVFGHVVVKRFLISEKDRSGIGTFLPKDEKSQDSTEFTGDINYREIAKFGTDSDPRVFDYAGEFCVANRGILDITEMLKLSTDMLYELLSASQESNVKGRKHAHNKIDEMIVGSTNEPEFRKLENDSSNQALFNRIIPIPVPYVTKLQYEQQIYEKDYTPEKAGMDIAPHAIEVAAKFAVMSRLEAPGEKEPLTLLEKMKLYNGEHVHGHSQESVKRLRRAAKREAFDGVSPRDIQNIIDGCLVDTDEKNGVTAFAVLAQVKRQIESGAITPNEEKQQDLLKILAAVKDDLEEQITLEVQSAITADEKQLKNLRDKYLQNVKAWHDQEKIRNPYTDEEEDPDESFMDAIESSMEPPVTNPDDHRQTLMGTIGSSKLGGNDFDLLNDARMRKALVKKLWQDTKDQLDLNRLTSAWAIDDETQERIDIFKRRLKENHGYNDYSAHEVLSHVASIFANS